MLAFADRLAHATILDGILLSRARLHRFRHNDVDDLRRRLAQAAATRRRGSRFLVATESVSAWTVTWAPLAALAEAAGRYEAMLLVDEAHALGVLGPQGAGLVPAQRLGQHVNACTGTLSKALASYGGFVCCSTAMRELFDPSLAAADLQYGPPAGQRRGRPGRIGDRPPAARSRTHVAGPGRVVPQAVAGGGPPRDALRHADRSPPGRDNAKALRLSERLKAVGILAPAIREPTVPRGTARLRLSVTLCMTRMTCGAPRRLLPMPRPRRACCETRAGRPSLRLGTLRVGPRRAGPGARSGRRRRTRRPGDHLGTRLASRRSRADPRGPAPDARGKRRKLFGLCRIACRPADRVPAAGDFVGWSMGGLVALETAIRFPRLVGRLAVISAAAAFCATASCRWARSRASACDVARLATGSPADTAAVFRRRAGTTRFPLTTIAARRDFVRRPAALAAGDWLGWLENRRIDCGPATCWRLIFAENCRKSAHPRVDHSRPPGPDPSLAGQRSASGRHSRQPAVVGRRQPWPGGYGPGPRLAGLAMFLAEGT